MPFTLCKSERRRIDELVDHVKGLSDIVNELRAEVEKIKICTNKSSNESLNQRRNRAECNTLQKLKKCLQKNVIPVFSRDPTYKVRKKCQQMFSQMPKIIPQSANLPKNHQNFSSSSCSKIDKNTKKSKSSHTQYFDETEAKRRRQNITTSSQRKKNLTNDYPKDQHLEISSSSSQTPKSYLKTSHQVYNPSYTNDTSNLSKKSRNNENVRQFGKYMAKKKTAEASTATTNLSQIKIGTPKKRLIDSEIVQRRRSVTFVDREKKNSLDKDSSLISSLSNNNVDYNVSREKPKADVNTEKTVNSIPQVKKIKKISRSAQCSTDCEYKKKLPVHLKNVYTSTHAYDLKPENKNINNQKVIKKRRKDSTSKSTQTTLKLDKYTDKMCPNGRRKYCPKAKRISFPVGSQSTLTSCSQRSISSFCLGSEELGEGLMYRYWKREAIPHDEKLKKKQTTIITEEPTGNGRKARLFSSRESREKKSKAMNMKPYSKRRKRTYLISSELPLKNNDEAGQCNLDEERANYSSEEISTFPESESKQRKIRNKWKEYDGQPKANEDHQLPNKQQSSPDKRNNYIRTSVSQKNQTKQKFAPKLKRRSNWTVQKRNKKPTKFTELAANTSSSSYACTDETCSLTSDPQISSSNGSVNSSVKLQMHRKI